MSMDPSVPFLKPTLIESAEASSRWTCDSVVRAPIAPHETSSAVNWGEMVSVEYNNKCECQRRLAIIQAYRTGRTEELASGRETESVDLEEERAGNAESTVDGEPASQTRKGWRTCARK